MEAHRHLKFISVELAGGAERPTRGDAMLSSASQPRYTPRHRPLERAMRTGYGSARGEGGRRHHHRWERGGGVLPPPPMRRKKGNHGRIQRRGGSTAGGEGEGALPSGDEWPPQPPSEWGREPRPPSGWGMAYRHRRGGLRPLSLGRVRWREPYLLVRIMEVAG
jgi:hypothetical protein